MINGQYHTERICKGEKIVIDILEGEQVTKYFSDHPEAVEALKKHKYQFKFPETFEPGEEIYRPLTQEDIRFISFEGWEGQPGVYAWYYPMGAPTYCKIG